MGRLFLSLLVWAGVAAAQPLWGPWEIVTTSDTIQTLYSAQIAIIDSQTARIFYSLDVPAQCDVWTALFDLTNHEIIGSSEIVSSDIVPRTLRDAAVDGLADWVFVYDLSYDQNWVYTRCLIGSGTNRRVEYIGASGQPNVPWLPSYSLTDFNLGPRVGGGWLLNWVQLTFSGPYQETSIEIHTAGLSHDSIEYRQPLLSLGFHDLGPSSAAAMSVSPDCSLVITGPLWLSYASVLLRVVRGADGSSPDTVCTYDPDIRATSLRRASNGSLLVYSESNTLFRINESRECVVLGELSSSSAPADIAFQTSFGFAGLWINPNWIQLGRIDENGAIAERGVFYWWDGDHVIQWGSIDVAPDGRIYVAWTEKSNSETRLMISRIDWDTFLDTEPSSFIPQPSSFVLSAYPNPFNGTLRVQYDLPDAQDVELAVFNVLGQQVTVLANGMMEAGVHEAIWNPHNASGGIYFMRLHGNQESRVTKVIYLR